MKEVYVYKTDINCFMPKPDALLVYMKNGKVWVCDKSTEITVHGDIITLKLKGSKGE